MRQAVGFCQAIRKRKARDSYDQFCMHAVVNGGKVKQSFEEMYPDYEDDIFQVALDPETVSIMDKLAEAQHRELTEKWQRTNS